MIAPAIGRRVLYMPRSTETSYPHKQPFVAFVTHIHSRHTVNLFVINDSGIPFVRVNAQLLPSHDAGPGDCCYPPYDLDRMAPIHYPEDPFI